MNNEQQKLNNNYRSIRDNPALEQTSQLNTKQKSKVKKRVTHKASGGISLARSPKPVEQKEDYALLQSDNITAQVSRNMGTAQAQLLDYINYQATKSENSIKDGKITISVKEYAQDNGLKFDKGNEKYPKKKARKLLFDLAGLHIEFNGGNKKSKYKYPVAMMTPIPEYDTSQHGKIIIGLSPTYQKMITEGAFYTPIPIKLFQLDPNHQPVAYAIGRYLCHNKRANAEKEQHRFGNALKIETLLSHCKGVFPDPRSARRFSQQIYEPFMKAVGEDLVGIFDFSFMDSGGNPTDLINPTKKEFLASYIIVTDWHGYPYDKLAGVINRHKQAIANHKRSKTLKNKN